MITEDDIHTYTDGYCHIFAFALHERYEYPIFLVKDRYDLWTHAVVKRRRSFIDIRGVQNLQGLYQEFKSTHMVPSEGLEGYENPYKYKPLRLKNHKRYLLKRARKIVEVNHRIYKP